MLRYCHIFLLFAMHTTVWSQSTYEELVAERRRVAKEIEHSIQHDLLDRWYPMSMDKEYGGFLSTFTYDFKPTGEQDKMIVTQARHTWTNAKAALRFPSKPHYKAGAKHGFEFLKNAMWDKEYGGFYQLVDRKGKVKGGNDKTAYGNAFAIFALAAYYAQ